MAWDDKKKTIVIEEYKDIMDNQYDTDEARANATTEIVAQLAEKHGEAVNGVRTILSRAGAYIKKSTVVKEAKTAEGSSKRVNKAEAHNTLKELISAIDPEMIDTDIIDRLTGKAALYFASILQAAPKQEV